MPTPAVHPVEARPREELRLKVGGMHCASCAANVQRALEAQPGVRSAVVSVTDGRATIAGDHLASERLVQAVIDSGFSAEALDEAAAPAEMRSEIELRQQSNERRWRRRAVVGLSIWAPMELLHWIGGSWDSLHQVMPWVMLVGATAVMVMAGAGFFRSAIKAALRRTTNMDTLIAIGATTAYVFSLAVFIGQQFGRLADQPLYFAESAALLGIISLGHWLEARAAARAGSAVRELLELQPDRAERLDVFADQAHVIPTPEVRSGDLLLIRPGARVAVDGVIVDGASDVYESVVSGEPLPVARTIGDAVVAGSMNTTGRLVIRASVDGRHTTIARIADLVQRAQASKADVQRLADRVSAVFVPAVLTTALLTFIGWWLAGDVAQGVAATVAVLIISCPCALGLATPMAVMVGAGAASRRGILIKSAMALEAAGRARIVVFDKTGTLTTGQASVTKVEARNSAFSETQMLQLAAAVESASEHPIARAIVRAATQRGLEMLRVDDFQAIPGHGVQGVVNGRLVSVLRDQTAACGVEIDGSRVGAIWVDDRIRADARPTIDRLKAMGMRVMLLSGDRRAVAEALAVQAGIALDDVVAEVTPDQKLQHIAATRGAGQGGGRVIMVGDGINDAAALAEADLGIALAGGTNIAMESADVVIPGQRVMAVAETVDLSRRTLRTIKQNLFFAFIYNVVAIPAAALGLLGVHGPLIAAAAMGLSDVTVIGNALRLKRRLQATD